jgi:hypothetical protein
MGVIGYYPLDTAELFSISLCSVSRLQGSQRVLLRMLLIREIQEILVVW